METHPGQKDCRRSAGRPTKTFVDLLIKTQASPSMRLKHACMQDRGLWTWTHHWSPPEARGGYLVERWVRGCAAQIGCFFGLSGFPMAPFLFENWFRYRSHFRKMHKFRWIFPFSLPIGCQKVLMHPNLYGKKYWLVLKRVLQEVNGLVIGCKFASSLVLLLGGGRNFGPHIRTQPKVEYPPGGSEDAGVSRPNGLKIKDPW